MRRFRTISHSQKVERGVFLGSLDNENFQRCSRGITVEEDIRVHATEVATGEGEKNRVGWVCASLVGDLSDWWGDKGIHHSVSRANNLSLAIDENPVSQSLSKGSVTFDFCKTYESMHSGSTWLEVDDK